MTLKRLFTYSFDPNVGALDRFARITSGLALIAVPSLIGAPGWGVILLGAAGLAWAATGVLSRCGVYYLFGVSTLGRQTTPARSAR